MGIYDGLSRHSTSCREQRIFEFFRSEQTNHREHGFDKHAYHSSYYVCCHNIIMLYIQSRYRYLWS